MSVAGRERAVAAKPVCQQAVKKDPKLQEEIACATYKVKRNATRVELRRMPRNRREYTYLQVLMRPVHRRAGNEGGTTRALHDALRPLLRG